MACQKQHAFSFFLPDGPHLLGGSIRPPPPVGFLPFCDRDPIAAGWVSAQELVAFAFSHGEQLQLNSAAGTQRGVFSNGRALSERFEVIKNLGMGVTL